MTTAENTLIKACIDAGFTEDYAKMIFKINPDTSSAFVEAIILFAKQHVEGYAKSPKTLNEYLEKIK